MWYDLRQHTYSAPRTHSAPRTPQVENNNSLKELSESVTEMHRSLIAPLVRRVHFGPLPYMLLAAVTSFALYKTISSKYK